MSSFRKYFSHHFKESLMRTLVLSTLAILLTFTFVTSSSWTGDYHTINGSYENTTTVTGSIAVLGVIAAILSTIRRS